MCFHEANECLWAGKMEVTNTIVEQLHLASVLHVKKDPSACKLVYI